MPMEAPDYLHDIGALGLGFRRPDFSAYSDPGKIDALNNENLKSAALSQEIEYAPEKMSLAERQFGLQQQHENASESYQNAMLTLEGVKWKDQAAMYQAHASYFQTESDLKKSQMDFQNKMFQQDAIAQSKYQDIMAGANSFTAQQWASGDAEKQILSQGGSLPPKYHQDLIKELGMVKQSMMQNQDVLDELDIQQRSRIFAAKNGIDLRTATDPHQLQLLK